jgi:host factor-I protein
MKNGSDNAAVGRAPEPQEFVTRKLIRPPLERTDANGVPTGERKERQRDGSQRRVAPAADQTHAENFYFQKQMQAHTQLTITLKTGEMVLGTIEWFDKNCIKINRGGRSSMLVYKNAIRFMHKTEEL